MQDNGTDKKMLDKYGYHLTILAVILAELSLIHDILQQVIAIILTIFGAFMLVIFEKINNLNDKIDNIIGDMKKLLENKKGRVDTDSLFWFLMFILALIILGIALGIIKLK